MHILWDILSDKKDIIKKIVHILYFGFQCWSIFALVHTIAKLCVFTLPWQSQTHQMWRFNAHKTFLFLCRPCLPSLVVSHYTAHLQNLKYRLCFPLRYCCLVPVISIPISVGICTVKQSWRIWVNISNACLKTYTHKSNINFYYWGTNGNEQINVVWSF